MIEVGTGDILKANVEAIVNTVNCVGVMGRGLALQFRNEFPENYDAYKAACDRDEVRPGSMFIFAIPESTKLRYIINFPTKLHWKRPSQLKYIDTGLEALIGDIIRLDIRSIAIPPLGCGLGGLNWSDVRPRIEEAFAALPNVRVILFDPV